MNSDLDRFLQYIVDDHDAASGLKPLQNHLEIVAYAHSCGFPFTLADWGHRVFSEQHCLSDPDLEMVMCADPMHWTWAFKQIAPWRSLLMEGARGSGCLQVPRADPRLASSASPTSGPLNQQAAQSDEDSALQQFITLAQNEESLKNKVKEARCEDELIALALERGYRFSSLALLRRWSEFTDFSRPTWYGWFPEA